MTELKNTCWSCSESLLNDVEKRPRCSARQPGAPVKAAPIKRCYGCGEQIPKNARVCPHCDATYFEAAVPDAAQAEEGAKKHILQAVTQEKLLVMLLESHGRLQQSLDQLSEEQRRQTHHLRTINNVLSIWFALMILAAMAWCAFSFLGLGSILR